MVNVYYRCHIDIYYIIFFGGQGSRRVSLWHHKYHVWYYNILYISRNIFGRTFSSSVTLQSTRPCAKKNTIDRISDPAEANVCVVCPPPPSPSSCYSRRAFSYSASRRISSSCSSWSTAACRSPVWW